MQRNIKELYHSTFKKYRKYKSRYDNNLSNGRFFELSNRRQIEIIDRLKKIFARLRQLKFQLKLAAASGVISIALSTSPVQSQQLGPFIENEGANPIRSVSITGDNKKLTFADLDNDGDLDVAMGIQAGTISYFENIGDLNHPRFIERTGTDNPFSATTVLNNATPQLVDFDGDGDADLIVGEFNGYFNPGVRYFQNNDFDDGILGNDPGFIEITGVASPINNVSASKYDIKPAIVDIDNDGDFDVFLGQDGGFPSYQSIIFYVNNDFEDNGIVDNMPRFTGQALPTGLGEFGFDTGSQNTTPTFFDYDGDGDFDLFIGGFIGQVRYFENTDIDASDPADTTIGDDIAFVERTGALNPLDAANVLSNSVITFADLDGDGDGDAIIGNNLTNDPPEYRENTPSGFVELTGLNNPFDAFDIDADASPTFVDIDNDGDMDAIIGGKYKNDLSFVRNDNGIFTDLTGTGTPFDGLSSGSSGQQASPAFIQADTDVDFDLFVGFHNNPTVIFFRNSGSITTPIFSNEGDPFGLPVLPGTDSSPTFGDLDNDGDYEAIVGFNRAGQMRYFDRTSDAPTFIEITGPSNPFDGFAVGSVGNLRHAKPDLVDLDHDGDLDLAIGVHSGSSSEFADGTIAFLENDGSANFTELTGTNNPFDGIKAAPTGSNIGNSEPTFVDIDLDGDLDMFVGNADGRVQFFENQNLAPQLTAITSTSYTEDNSPITLDVTLTIADDSNDDIIGATVSIISNLNGSEDVLSVTPQFGVTGSFSSSTGVLTLSGSASLANYETVLRSVTYQNTSQSPNEVQRDIQISVTDFDATNPSTQPIIAVDVVAVNDLPVLASSASSVIFIENGTPIIVDNSITINDVDDTNIDAATVSITTNFSSSEDFLSFTDQNGVTGAYNTTTGVLSLSGSASLANYEFALQSITYQNSSDNPTVATRTITYEVNDGSSTSIPSLNDVVITPVNDAPMINTESSGDNITYAQNGTAIVMDNLLLISDLDNVDLFGATVQINGFINGDNLVYADQNGITGSFNSGVLTLSGQATVNDYETALASIAFESSNGTGSRSIDFVVNDGIDDSAVFSIGIDIQAPNQAPVVNTTPSTTQVGSIVTIDLCNIISDPDNNFDELTLNVVSSLSNAATSIDDCILTIDYRGTSFFGQDQLIIEACDPSGECDQNTLEVTVEEITEVNIYNAVSPNGRDGNDWWVIDGLSTPNTIAIYNRWGDVVKVLDDYNGSPNTPNDKLDDLPSATYFYEIKSDQGSFTGYLVIKK